MYTHEHNWHLILLHGSNRSSRRRQYLYIYMYLYIHTYSGHTDAHNSRVVLLHGSNGSGRRRQLGPCFAVRGAESAIINSAIINSAIINSAIIISAIRAIVHSTSRCRRERRLQAWFRSPARIRDSVCGAWNSFCGGRRRAAWGFVAFDEVRAFE